MSSDFSYAGAGGESHAHIRASEEISGVKQKSSRKIEKGLKRLMIIAAVIFIAELIWLFGITPFVPFSTVEVHGFSGFEQSDILAFAGVNETSSFISTNAKAVQEKISSHLLVESAVVIKRFPDKLSIFLTPRTAAAVALADTASGQVPVFIDRHGVFFKKGDTSFCSSLPVLSGFENPQLNMRLPSGLVPLLSSISEIGSSSPELLAAVSEIRIERKSWDGFDLILFPVHSSIKVRIENNLTDDILRYMLLVLSVFEESAQKPSEIDFRSGMGAYKIKEQLL